MEGSELFRNFMEGDLCKAFPVVPDERILRDVVENPSNFPKTHLRLDTHAQFEARRQELGDMVVQDRRGELKTQINNERVIIMGKAFMKIMASSGGAHSATCALNLSVLEVDKSSSTNISKVKKRVRDRDQATATALYYQMGMNVTHHIRNTRQLATAERTRKRKRTEETQNVSKENLLPAR